MCEGEAQQCVSALQVKPAADMGAVLFNCSNANAKLASDVVRAHSCGDEFENPALGRGKLSQAGPLFHEQLAAAPPVQKICR